VRCRANPWLDGKYVEGVFNGTSIKNVPCFGTVLKDKTSIAECGEMYLLLDNPVSIAESTML
jgi:hypothetical protein